MITARDTLAITYTNAAPQGDTFEETMDYIMRQIAEAATAGRVRTELMTFRQFLESPHASRIAIELRSPVICNGRYAHFLDVDIRGWGKISSTEPNYRMRFALMQCPLRGEGVGGQVPYWQYQAENPKNPSSIHGRRTGRYRSWIFKHLITPCQSSFV